MTKTFKYLSCLLVGALAVGAWSCSADEYSMPQPNITPEELVEGVAFTVEHDAQNPNIIHLTSLMPTSYQVMWETPQGRKSGATASLSIPFDGDYQVKMGVNTRGGYVWSEPYTFTVDDFCADFVNHYMWTRLSGGVGQSKTWQLDLGVLDDGTVKTTFWKGPHYFFTNTYTWDNLHAASENENTYANYKDSDPWKADEAIVPNSDWYWTADYPGNSWMCAADNYGYITFDLIGGANATITDADGNVVSKGTYMLDPDGHKLTFSDTYALETTDTRTHVREFNLLYLSDDALQIMALPEGVSLNYVTKDYFENYSEPVPTEITLPEGWYDTFTTQIKYSAFKLDEMAPFDWYDLGGAAKNGFSKPSEYPADFALNVDAIENFKLNLCDPAGGKYTAGDVAGDVTISEKGIVTLSAGLGGQLIGGNVVKLEGESFQVISITKDDNGRMESFVLGLPQYDVNGTLYQYLGYNFVANYGNGVQVKNYRCNLAYANSGFVFDYGELYIQQDGQYSVTVNVSDPAIYLLYFDVERVLKDKPNFNLIITDIKLDGNSTGITDADVEKTVGDTPDVARRYILNPWNESVAPIMTPKLTGGKSITVDYTVIMESSTPWVTEE